MVEEKLNSLLNIMGDVDEPWGLFEPYIWRDKLGDSQWHCEMRSNCAQFWHGTGDTPLEAVEACYDKALTDNPPNPEKE